MTEHVVPVEAVDYTLAQFDDTLTALLAALGYDPATQSVLRDNPFGRNALEVTGATSPVSVDTGDAIVNGRRYWNDAAKDIVIPTPSAATRIDRIVLRLDYTGSPQTITAERLAGVEGGAAPALTQTDGTTWEVSLAQVSITTAGAITITDERAYVGDAGIVNAAMAANSVDSDQYVDGSIDTEHVANDAIDDTKAGNRVAQFYRRQGGSATHWAGYGTSGTTTYTPGAVRMQGGFYEIVVGDSANNGDVDITFPVEFSAAPLVFVTLQYVGVSTGACARLVVMNTYQYSVPSATQFTLYWYSVAGDSFTGSIAFTWLAIGPE